MLRLPKFGVVTPDTVEGVVEALQAPGARIVAGGTDILPNLKHRLDRPERLVSLTRVKALRSIEVSDGGLRIGASVTLTEIAEHAEVGARYPSLAQAAGLVASPLIRNMGTLGGNLNLDTRCRYVNQTDFWRSAIGGCLKSDGDVCWVVPNGQKCVAAMSSDCTPVLISLDATVVLIGPGGERRLPLADYFVGDGVRHTVCEDGELMTEVHIPAPSKPRRSAYSKWTVRRSIDYPLLSVALRFDLAADDVGAEIVDHRIVVGVLAAKPKHVARIPDIGERPLSDPAVAAAVARAVHRQCRPLENVPYEAPYRRQMLEVHTRRAVERLVAAG